MVPADEVDSADYYVSEAPDGKKYALIAMHISKVLPNWTWATFEHQNNPGRCDYTGCHDAYGAVVADVDANDALDQDLQRLRKERRTESHDEICRPSTRVGTLLPEGQPDRLHLGDRLADASWQFGNGGRISPTLRLASPAMRVPPSTQRE
ncbi:hypothetical protein ACOJBM_40890 [Rhizobium beringeri]